MVKSGDFIRSHHFFMEQNKKDIIKHIQKEDRLNA